MLGASTWQQAFYRHVPAVLRQAVVLGLLVVTSPSLRLQGMANQLPLEQAWVSVAQQKEAGMIITHSMLARSGPGLVAPTVSKAVQVVAAEVAAMV